MSPGDESDEDLVVRFRQGDAGAFEELVLRHRDSVYRFVRSRLLVGADEAEDVTQNVFVEFLRSVHRFRGQSRLRTWILGIAVNLCRQQRRSWSRRPLEARDEALRALPDVGPSLQALVEGRQLAGAVRGAIESLVAEHRVVVLLREIEGFSYAEIAELLKVPVGTVRSRLHNARAELFERLRSIVLEEGD